MHFYHLTTLGFLASLTNAGRSENRTTCTIEASGTNSTDDAPAIRTAFERCGHHGKVIIKPTTYYVNSVLNITNLEDVEIDMQGTLLVCLSL
jgi:hypothetical protein